MAVMEDFGVFVSTSLVSLRSLRKGVPTGLPAELAAIAPSLKKFDQRIAEIEEDENLSLAGKSVQFKAALDAAVADVEKWRSTKATTIDAQVEGQRRTLQAAAEKLLSKPTELQVGNMVQRLRDFDPLEVEILYSDATDEERLVIEAASDAIGRQPVKRGDRISWEPIISVERVAPVKEARIERSNPEAVLALHDLGRIRTTYDILAGSAKQLLTDAVPVAKL